MHKYEIWDIKWDTDGIEEEELPFLPNHDTLESEEPLDEDEISDYLSDIYGFCHKGFMYKEIER